MVKQLVYPIAFSDIYDNVDWSSSDKSIERVSMPSQLALSEHIVHTNHDMAVQWTTFRLERR